MVNKIQNRSIHRGIPMPIKGVGGRAFRCNRYDECLYKAAIKDWFSFNCEHCHYQGKQGMDFIAPIVMSEIENERPNGPTEVELVNLFPADTLWESLQEEIISNDRSA